MICDLFIRSYWRDLPWLSLCLASIARHCHGFRGTVVVLPRSSQPWLRRSVLPDFARIEFCRDYRDDYLGQQATKLAADIFTDADFISHVDSDCIFTRTTNPEDLIVSGRPRVHRRPIALLGRERPWHASTEGFLGWPVTDDFMYHPPFTFPRWLYPVVRDHGMARHGVDVDAYLQAQPPRGFSEFNVLGALAWERFRDRFDWAVETLEPPRDPFCRWYWSWGGLDPRTRAEIEEVIDGLDSQRHGR